MAQHKLVYFETWLDNVAVELLSPLASPKLTRLHYATSEAENWAALAETVGYQVAPRTELQEPWFVDRNLIGRAPNLLAVSSSGAGYDVVDVAACTEAGIIVCNQAGANREAVAEHALGLMLGLSKKIALVNRALRSSTHLDRFLFQGNDLRGKTIGIVGYGNIGKRLGEFCRGLFAMTVLVYDPYLTDEQVTAAGGIPTSFSDLLARSDFVSVNCPRNDETMGMFRLAQFAQMKPSAYFVNTARGGIHDEEDLASALRQKLIAGAGLDVYLKEPPPAHHPLLLMDNVISTPHTAGVTAEACYEMAVAAAEQWKTIFAAQLPQRLINPEAWPRYRARYREILGTTPPELSSN